MSTDTPTLIWGAPEWTTTALALAGAAALALLWSYLRARAGGRVRLLGFLLKSAGFAALILSLVEPLLSGTRPRPGANAFAILADGSQSLQVRDPGSDRSRGDWVRDRLQPESTWQTRLGQDFDVRSYVFDSQLRSVEGFESLAFDGNGSAIGPALGGLGRRFRGLPLAGVLLFTDGNRTDAVDLDAADLPPIYPVIPPTRGNPRDLGLRRVSVSQTNFEEAPVVVRAEVVPAGFRGEPVVGVVLDEAGSELARQELTAAGDGEPLGFRFQVRPPRKGVNFYRVQAFAAGDEPQVRAGAPGEPPSGEQTLANNARQVVVDQGGGPYRVLYLGGRPNWEFKYIRRALADDPQVDLVGMIRIAVRQPKFDFRNPRDRSTSPLFKGFDNTDADSVESADQPVLVRLGTEDEAELRDGFPKTAEELYRYHAIVLDDLEAGFFTADQLALIRNFVSVRGGGLLMLGGPDSFAEGKYDRTPVGELLPVYLNNRPVVGVGPGAGDYRLSLTREGWLQPWVRLRTTEDDERRRLGAMPPFQTVSRVGSLKPGAVVLAEARGPAGDTAPALVAQPFGQGQVGALLIADLWRWGLRREDPEQSDLERAWRQAVRWLVADVPGRVEVITRPGDDPAAPTVELSVRVKDAAYRPLDNAAVALEVRGPEGENLALVAEPDGREAGRYSTTFVARRPGSYRIVATATAPDGSAVGSREAGWVAQPSADEFARLEPDRDYLQQLADRTGGELVDGDRLDAFVAGLSARSAPITEPWTAPIWHQPLYFLLALACFGAEWALRRINGLP